MKRLPVPLLCLTLLSSALLAQQLSFEPKIVPENAPPGTVAGSFSSDSFKSKYVLPGIHEIADLGNYLLLLLDGGEVWLAKDPGLNKEGEGKVQKELETKVLEKGGVRSLFVGKYHGGYLKSDGSLWGIYYTMAASLFGEKPRHGTPIENPAPVEILQSGVKDVRARKRVISATDGDGNATAVFHYDGRYGLREKSSLLGVRTRSDTFAILQDGSLWWDYSAM